MLMFKICVLCLIGGDVLGTTRMLLKEGEHDVTDVGYVLRIICLTALFLWACQVL